MIPVTTVLPVFKCTGKYVGKCPLLNTKERTKPTMLIAETKEFNKFN